ncbi:purine-cytosine permease family protein [Hypericibacter sp.]|uniref:purine-cytosine permease family protein n=1 Tax=Hypericibacter sp. TaxID=2705401 RepID=UPI003D6C911B
MVTAEQAAGEANQAFAVEQNGINLIPDSERRGHPRELFWVWAGANLILTYIIVGGLLAVLGLTMGQMLLVVIVGNLLYWLIGYNGIPGARVGTATLVVSRAAFGRKGNAVPSFLSWLTAVGWEAVNLVLGTFALYSLVEGFGIPLGVLGKAILLGVLAVFTFGVAILGHATIVFMQRIFTWALGLAMLGLIPQVLSYVPATAPAAPAGADIPTFLIALTLVAAMPISYANCAADYTRYLPRNASGAAITFWTFLGSFIPAVIITVIGYMAAREVDLTDPIGGFAPILAPWYFKFFVLLVIGGSITNNFINTYSSGMSLLAMGLNVSRPKAIMIDAVLATAASVYAIFFYDFTSTFIAFLSLMVAWIAPWCAIYAIDIWLRRSRYDGASLLSVEGGSYRYVNGWHGAAFIAWVAGMIAALACTSADMLKSPFAEKVLGGADLSIVAGLVVSGLLYWVLAGREIAKA